MVWTTVLRLETRICIETQSLLAKMVDDVLGPAQHRNTTSCRETCAFVARQKECLRTADSLPYHVKCMRV